ncbi:hypothetical protein [Nitrosopumilus sp.]|uniref:DUF7467 domain-containing protein n=1 Tax=Nitrosopumilus sp. TaxID=2024843 RepID=UPI00262B5B0C|nr:hypothetical protein [Nitrosopumilus sp.]
MTKLSTTLTFSAIASILIIGGFAAATPNAFSTYGGWHDDDDDDDNCGNWNHGWHDDDDDDNCGNNEPRDPCDCERPDTLKFTFSAPGSEVNSEFRIEVYKKTDHVGNEDKILTEINSVMHNLEEPITLSSTSYHKDKLHSNTVFAVYKVDSDELVSTLQIHTSCSQDLYIGQTVSDNGYTLEITDGLKDGETSISASNPLTCGDEPEPEQTGTIVVRNALTVDNGGQAEFADFSYKVVDESGVEFPLTPDTLDPSIHVGEVPKGPYVLMQTIADEITESYTEVLITGDKKCPATTNESFLIKKDKTVSCTIYNDDNGDGSGGSIEPGVIFHFDTVKFDGAVTEGQNDVCDEFETELPCVFIQNDLFHIAPNLDVDGELRVSTLVLLSAVGLADGDDTMQDPEATTECVYNGLATSPNGNAAFSFQCSNLSANSDKFRASYALIETLLPGNEL